ncbi:MAG: LacI family DNA-binding transcriptional regulator [Thermomicrobiales bacterium]
MAQVQIKDVAARAEVSSATVSRVLNGDQGVAAARRERVLAAIEELGYQPNRVARSLRRRYTDTIGVVISDIENPHFTQAVRVIEDAAYAKGHRVLLCNTDETPGKQAAYLEMLAAERVVGVILAAADVNDPTIGQVIDYGIPVVAFDRQVSDPRADAVTSDNVRAGREATSYLLERGHTGIGFIAGRLGIQTGADRLSGYTEAMQERGLMPQTASGEFRIDEAERATAELLDRFPGTTAIVVGNNLMTIGAARVLRARGLSIPADISIVQIDDPFWTELMEPPLTSFGQPVREMASQAFTCLMERIGQGRTEARHVVFPFELRERASCRTIEPPPTG